MQIEEVIDSGIAYPDTLLAFSPSSDSTRSNNVNVSEPFRIPAELQIPEQIEQSQLSKFELKECCISVVSNDGTLEQASEVLT